MEQEHVTLLEAGNPNQILRASAILTYDFCPRCFKNVFIDGVKRGEGDALLLGRNFHDAIKLHFEHRLEISKIGEPVQEWLKWVIAIENKKMKEPDYLPPIYLEMYLQDPDLLLDGHIDRVDWYTPERQAVSLVEYKTGASFYERQILTQLTLYAVLWESVTGTPVKQLVVINPRLKIIKDWDFTEDLIKQLARRVAKVRHAIATMVFPQKCTPAKWTVCGLCEIEDALFPSDEVSETVNDVKTK